MSFALDELDWPQSHPAPVGSTEIIQVLSLNVGGASLMEALVAEWEQIPAAGFHLVAAGSF